MRYTFVFFLLLVFGLNAQAQTSKHQLFLGVNRGAFPPGDMLTLGIHAGYTYAINKNLGATLRLVQHQSNQAIWDQQTATVAIEANVQVLPIHFNRASFGFEAGVSSRNLVTTKNQGDIVYVNGKEVYVNSLNISYEFGGVQAYLLMPIKLSKRASLVARAGYVYYGKSVDVFDLSTGIQISL